MGVERLVGRRYSRRPLPAQTDDTLARGWLTGEAARFKESRNLYLPGEYPTEDQKA